MIFLFVTPHFDGRKQWLSWTLCTGEGIVDVGENEINLARFNPRYTGRKNYALFEGLTIKVVEQADIICIVDADVAMRPLSLARRLKHQFQDREIGVVSGMRRFTSAATMPSAVRLVWQHWATWLMWAADIPWGGCLAFRWDLLFNFKNRWLGSLFDDTMAAKVAEEGGYEFVHDRELVLEDSSIWTSWRDLWAFVMRQLIDVRLYGNWGAVWLSWLGLVGITAAQAFVPWFLSVGLYVGFAIGLGRGWRALPAVVIAQLLHLVTVPAAQLASRMRWADIVYIVSDFKREAKPAAVDVK